MEKNVSKKDNDIKSKTIIPAKRIKLIYETLNILLNKDHIFVVQKKKILEKSLYFKSKFSILGCNSDIIEVNIPVTKKSFQNVVDYVNTDTINISDDTVVEMLKIAKKIQIQCLYNNCLNHYVKKITNTTFHIGLLDLNTDTPQTDNNIKTQVLTEEENLSVCFNKENVIKVNKKKLLEKSHYFRAITKCCYADYKNKFIEIKISVDFKSFRKIMDYVATGILDIDDSNVFEMSKVADYLQIKGLSKRMFLDHFIFSLTRKTLEGQLSLIEKHPVFCNDFKEVALNFKENGRLSFSGLYYVEGCSTKSSVKLVTNDDTFYITRTKNDHQSYFLNYFDKCILFCIDVKNPCLHQYDLITGEFVHITLPLSSFSKICCSKEKVFVISKIPVKKGLKLVITVLHKKNEYKSVEVCEIKKYRIASNKSLLMRYIKRQSVNFFRIFFCLCDDDKLYIFHDLKFVPNLSSIRLSSIRILTICIKTMNIERNQNIDQNLFISCHCFDKLFFLKKSREVFVRIYYNNDKSFLVYNFVKQQCYFIKDPFLDNTNSFGTIPIFSVDKDDFVYRYRYEAFSDIREVKKYTYINKTFIDTSFLYKLPTDVRNVPCICVV